MALINLTDDKIYEVNYEGKTCLSEGCETCGYGGHWVKDFEIKMENGYCKFCGMKLLENGMCPNFSCVSNGFIL